MVRQEIINELREAIRQEYGVELDMKQAAEVANTWVGYFNLLADIDRREKGESKNPDTS